MRTSSPLLFVRSRLRTGRTHKKRASSPQVAQFVQRVVAGVRLAIEPYGRRGIAIVRRQAVAFGRGPWPRRSARNSCEGKQLPSPHWPVAPDCLTAAKITPPPMRGFAPARRRGRSRPTTRRSSRRSNREAPSFFAKQHTLDLASIVQNSPLSRPGRLRGR